MTATAQAIVLLAALACGGGKEVPMYPWHKEGAAFTLIDHKITQAAAQHGLPPAFVSSIVAVESGGNPMAARYEPAFRYTVPKANKPAACTAATEDMLQRMSLGPMQVMGAKAREMGYVGWLTGLCTWEDGLDIGCAVLAQMKARHFTEGGWEAVAAAYNAGSPRKGKDGKYVNQDYPDKVLEKLGGEWPGEG